MKIGIAYANPRQQVWLTLDLLPGATIGDAIARAAITTVFPEINLERQKVGVFGKIGTLNTVLADGDRVEIYRPLTADPRAGKASGK